jgi:hypothetical protein
MGRRTIISNNGPSFTKATYDHQRTRGPAPSPMRRVAALEQAVRDSGDLRVLRTDPETWIAKHFPKKDE